VSTPGRRREAAHRPHVLILLENLPFPRDLRVRREARALLDAGYAVTVICPGPADEPLPPAIEAVRVRCYPPYASPSSKLGFVREYLAAVLNSARLTVRTFAVDRFDVVQACNPPDLLFLIAAPFKLLGRPFVFDHHDLSPELFTARYGREDGLIPSALRVFERASIATADHVIATNGSVRDVDLQRGHKAAERVSIVRNGPELDLVQRTAPQPDLRRGRAYLAVWNGVMGSVDDGVDLALQAVHHLVHVLGRRDCQFAFVGDGEDRPRLERLASELDVRPWVSFPGWLPHERALQYLATATIGLAPDPKTPRLDKATSMKVMEYMAFGLPVVAFDVVETRVSAGEAGVYVGDNDPRRFATAVDTLLSDPERRRRLGQLGRQRIEESLAWDHQKATYIAVFDRLTRRTRRESGVSMMGTQQTERQATSSRALRVGLVGCGAIARTHVAALQELETVELVGVADEDAVRRHAIAAAAPGARPYRDLTEMLAGERLDAVHVLTPPATHARLALEAIAAGCHVLVEKPITTTLRELDEVLAAAERRRVVVSTCHNLLFTPAVQQARERVRRGDIGAVVDVVSFYGISEQGGNYSPERPGGHWAWRLRGGVFTNFLPHVISLQQAFAGTTDEVAGVAIGRSSSGTCTELVVATRGQRAPGTMTLSMRARPDLTFVEVYGEQGVIRVDLVREVCTMQRRRRAPRAVGKVLYAFDLAVPLLTGTARSALGVVTGRLRSNPGMSLLIHRFYDSIREGTPPPVSPEDARAMVATMENLWRLAPDAGSVAAPSPVGAPRTDVERAVAAAPHRPTSVLVTGAAGFLGRHVVTALARCGIEVRALVRDPARVPFDVEGCATVVTGDLGDEAQLRRALDGVEAVINCAATTDNRAPWEVHERANVDGVRNLLTAAADAGVARVVHVSSVAVYGLADGRYDERAPVEARDPWAYYPRSKLASEQVVDRFRSHGGPDVVVLRLGLLHGPGKPPKTGLLTLGRLQFVAGSGRNHLPYTNVARAVDGILLALTAPAAADQTYNLVEEPERTVRAQAALGADEGRSPVFVPVPRWLLLAAAGLAERRSARLGATAPPKLSRYTVRSATRDAHYPAARARLQLGWLAGPVGAAIGADRVGDASERHPATP
jgi:predicted dehydrogenase/nucleoside-diphosphate-sugar epimerase/glycosyltransferase involved in cell wall biosynthesis